MAAQHPVELRVALGAVGMQRAARPAGEFRCGHQQLRRAGVHLRGRHQRGETAAGMRLGLVHDRLRLLEGAGPHVVGPVVLDLVTGVGPPARGAEHRCGPDAQAALGQQRQPAAIGVAEVHDRSRAAGGQFREAVAGGGELRGVVLQEALPEVLARAVEQARVAELLDEAAEDGRLRRVAVDVDQAGDHEAVGAVDLVRHGPLVPPADRDQTVAGPRDVAVAAVDVGARRRVPADDPGGAADGGDRAAQNRVRGSHVTNSGKAVMTTRSRQKQARNGRTPRTTSPTSPRPRTACTT